MNIQDFFSRFQKKYLVLVIFIIFTTNNGFAWLMFEPVAEWLKNNVHGMSTRQLTLLSSWQPLVFLCMCIPIMKLVTRFDGLRLAVRIGTAAEIVGAVLKMIGASAKKSTAGLVFLHMGQVFSGIGSPVATGCVSALSATWFEPEERTRATAAAVLFNSVGNSLCYLFVPSMTKGLGYFSVTFYEVVMAAIALVLAWLVMPQEPEPADEGTEATEKTEKVEKTEKAENTDNNKNDSSSSKAAAAANSPLTDNASAEEKPEGDDVAHTKEHTSLVTQLKALWRIPSCVCLLVVYAWLSGGFSAWISLFADTYSKFYSEQFIGIMSFFGMIAYVVGGIASSYVVDLYFSRQMKYVIFFCITMNTLCNLIFIACTPNDKSYSLWNLGQGFIVVSTGLCGFWNGAAAPLFYELVAEISFPVEEGVSGICISVMENIGALVFYQVVSRFFVGQSMSVAYSFGMTVAVALSAAVKQRYNRTYHAYLLQNAHEEEEEQ
ncbi:Sugar transporter/Major Facilitator Superfamily [Lotmaria passim]